MNKKKLAAEQARRRKKALKRRRRKNRKAHGPRGYSHVIRWKRGSKSGGAKFKTSKEAKQYLMSLRRKGIKNAWVA